MDNNKINPQQFVDEFKDIPPMPNVMVRALEVIKNPQTGIRELSNIMSIDQAISTKTLSLVNSAYYGFHQQITSINKALVILGMMKAKNINPDDAFVIGFLHDIGKILLNAKNPIKYSKVRYIAQQNQADLVEIEDSFFGTNHCVLGALISKKWQLPVILTNCIRYHHNPVQSSLPVACGIVYIADRLVQAKIPTPILDPKVMDRLDIQINDPMALRESILAKASIFLKEMQTPL